MNKKDCMNRELYCLVSEAFQHVCNVTLLTLPLIILFYNPIIVFLVILLNAIHVQGAVRFFLHTQETLGKLG